MGLDASGWSRVLAAALADLLARPGSMVRAVTAYLVGIEMGVPEEAARALPAASNICTPRRWFSTTCRRWTTRVLRRGAACLHVVHGEAVAMLAALALVNRGYALLWQAIGGASGQRAAPGPADGWTRGSDLAA